MSAPGVYGIRQVEWTAHVLTCQECWRSWREDITPAGRCPWEDRHSLDRATDVGIRRRKAIVAGEWG